jgi:WD40 repeat protein
MAFSPDGSLLVSGRQDGSFLVWDVTAAGSLRSPIGGGSSSITSIAFSPDGQKLAVGDKDGRLVLHDVGTIGRSLLGETRIHRVVTTPGVAFTTDKRHPVLASIGPDNTIMLWAGETPERLDPSLHGQTMGVTVLAISPDGTRLVSGGADGTLVLWDVVKRSPITPPRDAHEGAVSNLAFSADGKKIVSSGTRGTLQVWDSGTLQPTGSPPPPHLNAVFAATFSPDGRKIASAASDGIRLWDLTTGKQTWLDQSLDESDDLADIRSVAFSPNGKILALGGSGGTVGLWDIAAQRQIGRLGADSSSLGLDAGQLTRSGAPSPMETPGPAVTSLTFSPDGLTIASGHGAGAVILWDVTTRQRLGPALDGHLTPVMSLAYSPDGRTLASASSARPAILWNADPRAWRDRVCAIARTNFTSDQWKQFFPNQGYHKTCPEFDVQHEAATPAR